MEINKQLLENVLSGKLKGKFVFKNVHNIYGVKLKPDHTCIQKSSTDGLYIIRVPSLLFNVVNTEGKSVYGCTNHKGDSENDPNYDIIDFIPDTDMKEDKLTIEIPKGKTIDWDESKKQNKIVLKNKEQLTYEEICKKLFKKEGYYFTYSDGSIGQGKIFNENAAASCPNYAPTEHQLECILAKNKLATVAKYLNDGWKPSCDSSNIFMLAGTQTGISVYEVANGSCASDCGSIWFKSKKTAQQAIEILGEEIIKLTLEPLGI